MQRVTVGVLALHLLLVASFLGAQPLRHRQGTDQPVHYQDPTPVTRSEGRNHPFTPADLWSEVRDDEPFGDRIPVPFAALLTHNYSTAAVEGRADNPRGTLPTLLQSFWRYRRAGAPHEALYFAEVGPHVSKRGQDTGAGGENRFLEGEIRVTSPAGAAESAIKVSPADPNLVIAGSNGPGSGQKMHYSSNGGETWTMVDLPLGSTCCDPTVEWSSNGSLAYAATLGNCGLSFCAVWFYRSDDHGQTWTGLESVTPGDPRRALTNSGSDKEYLHVDKHVGSACLDNVYLTWHDANTLQFARSSDHGDTWTTTSFSADPKGVGSDLTTDREGTIYYFWPAVTSRQIVVKRSTNCGASFSSSRTVAATKGAFTFPIPSMETRQAWIYVSADADLSDGPFGGSIYAAWTDTYAADDPDNPSANHTRIQLAFSRDRGWTWTVVTPHETSDANGVDRWNPWLAVGPDGRVDIVFYDTRNSIGRSGVDLYYAYSEDGGQTFGTPRRLTPVTSPNLGTSFEFGDYNGLDYLTAERFIAVYTDNRTEGSDVGDSPDVYATAPTATASDFISVNGAALQPPGGSVLYTHTVRVLQDGSAYSSRPGADTGVAVLELPHGRDIAGLRCVALDNNDHDSHPPGGRLRISLLRGALTTGPAGLADVISAVTSSAAGAQPTFQELIGTPTTALATVDNSRYSYWLQVEFFANNVSTDQNATLIFRGCSIRLR